MKSTQSLSLLQVVRELQRRTGNAPVDLDQCDGEAFIEAWLDIQDYQVDESFRSNLYQQTGGQALFTVDTLRAMQESQNLIQVESGSWVATPSLDWQRIPSRVDAILASEFARFPLETRSLLEIASLSDDGSVANVISMVSEIDEERVKSLLATLPGETQAWLQPQAPAIFHGQFGPVYHFRHRLYQDFVIQQISPAKRSTLHRKLAEALIDFYQAEPDAVASKIAYHFEQAGQFELAVPYLLQAAHHASSLSAHEYSIALLTHALEILSMLPPSSERDASELKVLNALSGQLLGGKGWGSEERLYATQRAYELCQQVGEATASQFLLTLFSLADMARARGQHAQSLALGQQMLQVARKRGDQEYLALTYWTLGASYFFQGNLSEARRNLEEVLSLHIPKASGLMTITGTDASVVSLCWLSWAYFLEGHHEKARSSGSAAVALANQIKHPFNQVFALTFGECGLHALCGDWEGVLTSLKTLLPLVEVDDLAPMLPWALVFQGWAQTMSGSSTDGIEHIHTGMNAWREAGAVSGLTCMGYYLADACLQVGRYREARMAVDKTLALVNKTDERLFEARLLRIRKALLHLDADV